MEVHDPEQEREEEDHKAGEGAQDGVGAHGLDDDRPHATQRLQPQPQPVSGATGTGLTVSGAAGTGAAVSGVSVSGVSVSGTAGAVVTGAGAGAAAPGTAV